MKPNRSSRIERCVLKTTKARLFDFVAFFERLEVLRAAFVFGNPVLGEVTGLASGLNVCPAPPANACMEQKNTCHRQELRVWLGHRHE